MFFYVNLRPLKNHDRFLYPFLYLNFCLNPYLFYQPRSQGLFLGTRLPF